MAIQLFIDTNAYLSFYHFTKDDIDALGQLRDLVLTEQCVLHLPEQVKDELIRNRDTRLSIAAKEFQKIAFATEIPRHMQGLQMAKAYVDAIADAKKAREQLIAEATLRARTYQLDVDVTIESLFGHCKEYTHDNAAFAAGKLRAERGNPPGKPDSFGDQYIWETLLANVPEGDLYVVTKDGDYVSTLDGKDDKGMPFPNAFLRQEWARHKKGNLYVFESIKALLTFYKKSIAVDAAPVDEKKADEVAHMPDAAPAEGQPKLDPKDAYPFPVNAKPAMDPADAYPFPVPELKPITDDGLLPEEREHKIAAIEELKASGTFADTHAAVAKLSPFLKHFTTEEANILCNAASSNSQISWIIGDSDVNAFFSALVSQHFGLLEPTTLDIMISMLGLVPATESSGEDPGFGAHWQPFR